MTNLGRHLRLTILVLGIAASHGELRAGDDTLVMRLVHPDQQAARVLSLFEGARAPHPAAALAAWKRATRDPGQLGKPLEAVIALFNPEMVPEWRVMHEAELHVDLGSPDGKPRWYALVPRDDGTLAAAITAARLTDGAEEAPAGQEGTEAPVQRLGPPGSMVVSRVGDGLILASSREELLRGLSCTRPGDGPSKAAAALPAQRGDSGESVLAGAVDRLDSGVVFELDPAHLAPPAWRSLALQRAGELLRGLACRQMQGSLALKGECLALEVTTLFEQEFRARPAPAKSTARRAAGVAGMGSLRGCHGSRVAGVRAERGVLGLGLHLG